MSEPSSPNVDSTVAAMERAVVVVQVVGAHRASLATETAGVCGPRLSPSIPASDRLRIPAITNKLRPKEFSVFMVVPL